METRCCKKCFQTIYFKKTAEDTLVTPLRYMGKTGGENVLFFCLFVHLAARGAICNFTLKMVKTLIKSSSRDDRPSIS